MIVPALLTAIVAAQAAPAPDDGAALRTASNVGRQLYARDRAAWVSTDQLKAAVPAETLATIAGWVIETEGTEPTTVTYFTGTGEARRAIYASTAVKGGRFEGRVLAPDTRLSAAGERQARAIDAARRRAEQDRLPMCGPAPFNVVAMPEAADGSTVVYLLSPQSSARSWPLGGHYRMTVARDGGINAVRPFTRTCVAVSLPDLPKGQRPVALFTNHILDPVPTEIHVFTSLAARMPLIVQTAGERRFGVIGDRVSELRAK